ncbi:hypothetical protein EV383_2160 [Pseudonocardia sediminis]|uniref:Uncharacterized protein n=1 Tax=Pseudonocardia sediminis TaxID=1397368 RepID=A0A4Q7UU85_PSEST|nr:alkaline shock response membrane anchor protein AmaP [Pseudonocardia sediminis]RZT85296.1 hypothetical protein EV383_2160 [Pseudonocardia sediminis]
MSATTGSTAADAPTENLPPRSGPAPRKAGKTAQRAVARSAGGSRWGLTLLGLVLLAAGVLTILLILGVFGQNRPERPILDPMVLGVLNSQLLIARIVAIVVGVLLVVFGLIWTVRALRPESKPDLVIDGGPGTDIRVSSSAAANAVADGASALPGVGRARARMVGSSTAPAVRATVWVTDEADVAEICRRLDSEVLTEVRDSLGLRALPVAVRLELESSGKTSRVS